MCGDFWNQTGQADHPCKSPISEGLGRPVWWGVKKNYLLRLIGRMGGNVWFFSVSFDQELSLVLLLVVKYA